MAEDGRESIMSRLEGLSRVLPLRGDTAGEGVRRIRSAFHYIIKFGHLSFGPSPREPTASCTIVNHIR